MKKKQQIVELCLKPFPCASKHNEYCMAQFFDDEDVCVHCVQVVEGSKEYHEALKKSAENEQMRLLKNICDEIQTIKSDIRDLEKELRMARRMR